MCAGKILSETIVIYLGEPIQKLHRCKKNFQGYPLFPLHFLKEISSHAKKQVFFKAVAKKLRKSPTTFTIKIMQLFLLVQSFFVTFSGSDA